MRLPSRYEVELAIVATVMIAGVRRQNIWRKVGRELTEDRPHLGVDLRRRVCGAASADVRWSVV